LAGWSSNNTWTNQPSANSLTIKFVNVLMSISLMTPQSLSSSGEKMAHYMPMPHPAIPALDINQSHPSSVVIWCIQQFFVMSSARAFCQALLLSSISSF
jgi:hypothetical protein